MNMRLTLVLLAAASLAGCAGFEPLYGAENGVAPALAATLVQTPQTRTGQLIREELDDEFGRAAGVAPRYRLEVDVDQQRFARGLRIDDTANRYELRLRVDYRLFALPGDRLIVRGQEPVYVTYDVADQPYAGIIAHQDGEERAANEAARWIREDVARALIAATPAQTAAR